MMMSFQGPFFFFLRTNYSSRQPQPQPGRLFTGQTLRESNGVFKPARESNEERNGKRGRSFQQALLHC